MAAILNFLVILAWVIIDKDLYEFIHLNTWGELKAKLDKKI